MNSKPEVSLYALRGLLSVRYTLVPRDKVADWEEQALQGWALAATTDQYALYENENWVPMGLTYDYYITPEEFDQLPEDQRAAVLMKALLLTEEQAAASSLAPLPEDQRSDCSWEAYVQDCADRRATAAEDFTATRTGFTAKVRQDTETLVLFAVPYDDGFSATVNGQPAEVLSVDNGLMAVQVPAGESEIVFTCRTPGLRLSAGISLSALAGYAVYLLVLRRRRQAAKTA